MLLDVINKKNAESDTAPSDPSLGEFVRIKWSQSQHVTSILSNQVGYPSKGWQGTMFVYSCRSQLHGLSRLADLEAIVMEQKTGGAAL